MDYNKIESFLNDMYKNRETFIAVNGISKLFDPKYMLISDILEDNKHLFIDVIYDHLNSYRNSNLIAN